MKIGHVHLKVKDLDRSEEFYSGLLGAIRTERLGKQYSFLSMGEAHHEIALQALGDAARPPAPHTVGLYHSAFEVRDAKELLGAVERLEGLKMHFALVDHGISWAVYASDPDGNGVEIYLDRRGKAGANELWRGQSRELDKEQIASAVRGER